MLEDITPVWAGSGMNCLVTFGFNHSGFDSGELDFEIASFRTSNLSKDDFDELLRLLDRVKKDLIKDRQNAKA